MPELSLALRRHRSRRRQQLSRLLLGAGVVLAGVGAVDVAQVRSTPDLITPVQQAATTVRPVLAPEAHRAPWVPGAPRRLTIPSLHVDAPVVPVRAPGGTLTPPSDPQTLGWWAGGAEPGSAAGTSVVAGHTVHTGGGALDQLGTLQPGARVLVRTTDRLLRYVVESVRVYSKSSIARNADRLLRQDGPGRLVVLTCDGWDGVRYHSNVVVTAVRAVRSRADVTPAGPRDR